MSGLIDPWARDPDFPRCPPWLRPIVGDKAKHERWGRFEWEPVGDSRIKVLGGWRQKHIVRVRPPQLERFGKGIWLHKEVTDRFYALISVWEVAGLLHLIQTWNGSYVARRIRGRRSLSSHAWGTAFDINARWNPIGKPPALIGEPGQVRDLALSAAEIGWFWGGWFTRRDGMHFEAV